MFKKNIKIARKNKGWTQEQAANELGIKKHNLSAYEEGRAHPPLETLKKFIQVYGIERQDVFNWLFEDIYATENA